LGRAAELYTGLCAEEPNDERLWISLFRVHERAGELLGLHAAEQKLRAYLVELGAEEPESGLNEVSLPPRLEAPVRSWRPL